MTSYIDGKYYVTYMGIIFDWDLVTKDAYNLIAEDKAKLALVPEGKEYKICEGSYIKK